MKKTTLMTITAAMAVAFGLSACTDAEMADLQHNIEESQSRSQAGSQAMINAERDCKTFVSTKIDLPMAAVSVSPGQGNNGRYTIPVRVKWDEPRVDERGECKVVDGRAVNYIPSYQ